MVRCVLSQVKLSELYILSSEKRLGLRPRPFFQAKNVELLGADRHLCGAQQTRAFDPMLFQYWPTANGAGPTLKQHWVESSCLLGELSAF